LVAKKTPAMPELGPTNKDPIHNKFGWCMDGNHSGCRTQFVYEKRAHICSCDCHPE